MERRDLRGYERLSGGYGESKIKKTYRKDPVQVRIKLYGIFFTLQEIAKAHSLL